MAVLQEENTGDVKAVKADTNQGTINALMKLMQNTEMAQALEQLAKRRDITVKIQFPYDSKHYEIMIDQAQ